MDKVAVHENRESEKVVEFISLSSFTDDFIRMHDNDMIYGVFYNESGDIVALDIWQEIHTDIIK